MQGKEREDHPMVIKRWVWWLCLSIIFVETVFTAQYLAFHFRVPHYPKPSTIVTPPVGPPDHVTVIPPPEKPKPQRQMPENLSPDSTRLPENSTPDLTIPPEDSTRTPEYYRVDREIVLRSMLGLVNINLMAKGPCIPDSLGVTSVIFPEEKKVMAEWEAKWKQEHPGRYWLGFSHGATITAIIITVTTLAIALH
jgi:hypothetical protein